MAGSPSAKRVRYAYTYTSIDDLPSAGKVHIYGVLKYVTQNRQTRNGGWYKAVGLHTESLYRENRKFTVTIFSPRVSDLPECGEGDIIRLHRVQIEKFNGMYNGRLQMHSGGSWVIFDAWTDNFDMMGCSSQEPTWDEAAEKGIITELRTWFRRDQPSDNPTPAGTDNSRPTLTLPGSASSDVPHQPPADTTNNQTTVRHDQSASASAANRSAVCTTSPRRSALDSHTALKSVILDSYVCINCQLLRVSTLEHNPDKLAILLVWDGTKPRLNINKSHTSDCVTQTHECGIVDQLSEYCVPIVVYGDHVVRAREMTLGALYTFQGVHCTQYRSVGRPELYLHESYKILAMPLTDPSQKDRLIQSLHRAVQDTPNVHLDIVADLKLTHPDRPVRDTNPSTSSNRQDSSSSSKQHRSPTHRTPARQTPSASKSQTKTNSNITQNNSNLIGNNNNINLVTPQRKTASLRNSKASASRNTDRLRSRAGAEKVEDGIHRIPLHMLYSATARRVEGAGSTSPQTATARVEGTRSTSLQTTIARVGGTRSTSPQTDDEFLSASSEIISPSSRLRSKRSAPTVTPSGHTVTPQVTL